MKMNGIMRINYLCNKEDQDGLIIPFRIHQKITNLNTTDLVSRSGNGQGNFVGMHQSIQK